MPIYIMFLFKSCDAVTKPGFLVGWQALCPYQQSRHLKACRESVHDHANCCSVPCLFFATASWICRGHAGGLRRFYCIHMCTTFKFMHDRQHGRIIVSLLTTLSRSTSMDRSRWLKLWANSWLLYQRLDSSQSFLGEFRFEMSRNNIGNNVTHRTGVTEQPTTSAHVHELLTSSGR